MSYYGKLRHVPAALTILRRRAGHSTIQSAAEVIRKKTGRAMGRPTLSNWEHGQCTPSLASLTVFLDGLGYDFEAFQDALDEAGGDASPESVVEAAAVSPPRATVEPDEGGDDVRRRLAELEERLRSLEDARSRRS
jgi:transcriptional regulator with XRE-family HTH domain